jgi:hypothetical protein
MEPAARFSIVNCVFNRNIPLQNLMSAWFEAARFAADAQRVIALRMMRLAGGGPLAATEASRMVAEKMAAFAEAQTAAAASLMMGGSLKTASRKAYAPYRRTVRANKRRLGS